MQSAPLMKSEHSCQQEINDQIVHSSVCNEQHLFRPFSDKDSGALTKVSQTLKYKRQRSGVSSRKGWCLHVCLHIVIEINKLKK